MLMYKGYIAQLEYDDGKKILFGETLGLGDMITFEGTNVDELEKAFRASVDDYLSFCKEKGEEPVPPESYSLEEILAEASGRTAHQVRVAYFMHKAGQEIPNEPGMPSAEVRKLRAKLIFEEAMETISALGIHVVTRHRFSVGEAEYEFMDVGKPDLKLVIDGCCDLSVVTVGTLLALGVPDKPFLEEVDAANLRKFEGDAHRRADGKWVKPSNFVGPDIAGVLEKIRRG